MRSRLSLLAISEEICNVKEFPEVCRPDFLTTQSKFPKLQRLYWTCQVHMGGSDTHPSYCDPRSRSVSVLSALPGARQIVATCCNGKEKEKDTEAEWL